MKKMMSVFAAVVMGLGLVACTEEVDAGVDTGVVIDRSRRSVTVLEDDGETDKHSVTKSVSRRCSVGERWPDCKK